MNGQVRREQIVQQLQQAEKAIAAKEFARAFNVSRQVIVGDIALLRAANVAAILSTPSGYVLEKEEAGLVKTIVSQHTFSQMQEELETIVVLGGKLLDVSVEHPVYGTLTASLRLNNLEEVAQFLKKMSETHAEPLLSVTSGLHSHQILVQDEEHFEKIREALAKKGLLLVE